MKEFMKALDAIIEEKKIDRKIVIEAYEQENQELKDRWQKLKKNNFNQPLLFHHKMIFRILNRPYNNIEVLYHSQ